MTGEVTDKDLAMVQKEVPIHERSGGLGHSKGVWLVAPAHPHGGERDPVNDWAKISFGSGIDNGPSETAPRLNRLGVLLE